MELISLGIVAEDGRELYCISSEFNPLHASVWVLENVLIDLIRDTATPRERVPAIALRVIDFIGDVNPVFHGYFADYDWVVFCQMFGTMMDLPAGFPMYCRDLKQTLDERGNPRIPFRPDAEHNALSDARWNKRVWEWLQSGVVA